MKKLLAIGLMATSPAFAGVEVISVEDNLAYEPIKETRRVCERAPRFNVGGAIIGSIIGNELSDSNGAGTAGALIGGFANNDGVKCRDVTEVVGYRQIVESYKLTVKVDGTTRVITLNR